MKQRTFGSIVVLASLGLMSVGLEQFRHHGLLFIGLGCYDGQKFAQ
ncbi:MAG TPA: hypothetical protein VKP30_15365 [Polyangiaceae bacterium]|nr:hypothetical protein [Polyangiaceae bacterium]